MSGPNLTDREKGLVVLVQQLIASAVAYSANHAVNKCFCSDCNHFRQVINRAAQTIEPLQDPEI